MWKIASILGLLSLGMFLIPLHADEEAQLQEVITRAIQAHGGTEVLTKYKAVTSKEKGKFHGLSQALEFTSETSMQLPDRVRTEVRSKVGNEEFVLIQVVNGEKGWVKIGDRTATMNQEMLAEAKEQLNYATISHLVYLKNKDYKLSPLGEVKVGSRPAVGIRVEHKGYRDVNLFFDKDKGLLLKIETRGKDLAQGGQEYTATILYDDYKKVEGMMVPHKITIEHNGKPYVEGEVVEVKIAEKLDESVFAKP